jgi:hypothetical protein
MKKLLSIIVLGLLLSGNAYADDVIKLGMSFYEVRKILKIHPYYPLKKTSKKYLFGTRNISGEEITYGFEYDGAKKIQLLGKKLHRKYKLVKIFNTSLERYDYYLNIPNIDEKDRIKLLKYKNMILGHQKFSEKKKKDKEEKIKIDTEKEQNELAKMIDKAKITCQTLGFEKGTDKFSDCTLKLYTQEVDNKVALEVAKQKSSSSSSNSGTMVIYDPVRDRQNKIDRGMKMLGGKCTLGVDC